MSLSALSNSSLGKNISIFIQLISVNKKGIHKKQNMPL